MTKTENTWRYGQVKSNALNVRREPSRKARRWNNVWPMNRLVLVKSCGVDGWYETLYRGEPAYVMAEFIASAVAGHSKTTTTMNRYAHARQDATRRGMEAIDQAYTL